FNRVPGPRLTACQPNHAPLNSVVVWPVTPRSSLPVNPVNAATAMTVQAGPGSLSNISATSSKVYACSCDLRILRSRSVFGSGALDFSDQSPAFVSSIGFHQLGISNRMSADLGWVGDA